MTTKDRQIERRWEQLHTWGPYGLLGVSVVLALASAGVIDRSGEWYAAWALVVAAVALQLWWHGTRARRAGRGRIPSRAGTAYYVVRWAIGFALTWIDPFFAFYAAAGYMDADELIPGRWQRLGLFASAVTVAAAQAGGLPFGSGVQWILFAALLVANSGLQMVVAHLTQQEAQRSRERTETITELERTNAALQQALDENAALHAQLLVQAREAGVADERRRLAAEIHDTIAQGLTGIIAQLQVVANTPDPEAARVHLGRASELARQSLGEARRSVHNLAPVALEHDGLPEALKKTVADWARRTGVRADFTLTGTAEHLHEEISATLLRIAQEALSNASRHARAARLGVTLSFMGDEVTLDVRDDGRGFDPAAVPGRTGNGGFGLDGMRARAERVAGSLTLESEPGRGTAVSARVPLVRDDR
ncbi:MULTISPECIES: sensor histidine kinase [Streptomyces]|jgi:signal transduction histidine kinase|uniref:sensor histidine kinase n=1 Tax=Streptomyces TaxID=1883 RepID=UPI000BE46FEE|nr:MULTISPECIES: sensor histidine kinase [Streptomyces]MCX5352123.1 sensor histidine kinase [Streptomyces mirabilis]QDN60214.1 sensor histidine kinase [Streptomyces sp. S1D4-20]QDN70270.1 sensor histidine kinase [Streptomyces sp. S1D4-14]QDN90256.1 sensor histidine kinase [Streptomyces sp. RLB3-6]QDO00883.1 sensor histidine kinase [Streptomyces sp. RLB1-9]